jgi:hypothetical protein
MRALVPAVLVSLSFAAAPFASAQSLGEVAARDKDKKKSGKVFTEDDLRGGKHSGTVSNPAAVDPYAPAAPAAADKEKKAEGAAAPAGEKPKTEEEIRAEKVQDWKDRLDKAQGDVTRLRAEVDRLQLSMNDMSGALYGSGRATKQQALDEAKKSLAAAQQQVTDLQEEGRRNRY